MRLSKTSINCINIFPIFTNDYTDVGRRYVVILKDNTHRVIEEYYNEEQGLPTSVQEYLLTGRYYAINTTKNKDGEDIISYQCKH